MSLARQLALPLVLVVLGAAIGCTTSEPYIPPAAGGGSGGMMAGSGGMMAGSGGMMDAGQPDKGGGGVDAAMDTGGGGGGLTFAKDVAPILAMHCNGCHGAAAMLMTSSLASVTGTATSACNKVDASKKRVVPGNPMASFLYLKVSTPTAMLTGCGNQMPRNGPPYLTAAEQGTIRDWIMQGAK